MKLEEIMRERQISAYRLAKDSKVPYSTVSDLLKGITNIYECSVLTVYKIAVTLNVSIESLIESDKKDFELFKSEVCHEVKRISDYDFITNTLKSRIIFKYYKRNQYREAFYLLAMLDYLSRINHLPLCKEYDKLRTQKLSKIIYPRSLMLRYKISQSKSVLEEARAKSIPEFIRFNIVENEIRHVA